MNRRARAVLSASSVALASTAAGISVNLATDRGGSAIAWILVVACTVVLVAVTAVVEALSAPPPDTSGIKLVIELDGRRIIAYTDEAVRELGHLATAPSRPDGAVPRAAMAAPRPDEVVLRAATSRPEEVVAYGATGGPGTVAVPAVVRVALVTRRRSTGITRRLERVHAASGAPALDVRLHVDDDPRRRLAGLLAAHVAVLDDHCSVAGEGLAPLVGGLDLAALRDAGGRGPRAFLVVLACRDGDDDAHARALASSLDGPAVLLAPRGAAPLEHRTVLLPALLGAVGDLAGRRVTTAELGKAVDGALEHARDQRPQMDWGRWRVRVLRA
ncbi:hypothetical protein [Actinomadura rupiterrae]|uniref:hypothetical protein n=1 Tax=Actinomadura rupiterrae TaxID=559627 RepID=UPI0020A4DDD0|nr:hypothetical protein [Actinomadura rupiterrae]MCP2337463.1 hypothetical protein [Actinomadura rupiterrae]